MKWYRKGTLEFFFFLLKIIRLRQYLLCFSTTKLYAKELSFILPGKGLCLDSSEARVGQWLEDKWKACISSKWQALFFSVQFSRSVMSDSLQSYGLQLARLLCPSPTPGVCSHSCPLSQWCHRTISSSVIPSSSCFQSFPASGSFLMSWLFT